MIAKRFPADSRIMYITNIFKFTHLKSWSLELCLRNAGRDQILHTRLSNLPALAKRRVINPSDGQSRKGGYPFFLSNISTANWQVGIDSEGGGNTFVFDYIRADDSTVTVHIPQIEFARVLFFHNAYLARNCIDHGLLSREFWIQDMQDDSVLVNVLPISSLPLKTFDHEGQRRLLAWVLIDKNARSSYESIAKNFIEEVQETEDKKTWRFKFSPPQLDNISLETRGWLDKDTDNYYIHEILGISNISSSLPKKAQFFSEKFKASKRGGDTGNAAKPNGSVSSDTIDDQQEADIDSEPKTIEVPTTSFSFATPIETRKVVKKRVPGAQGAETEDYDELVELDLGTDEATIDGTACQADFAGLDDDSDVLELYMQRFEAFKLLIKRLSEQPGIDCTEELHFLPAVGRSRLHRTMDGNRRSLLEVRVKTDTSHFVILEIDTTDNYKPISTLIIKTNDLDYWNDHMDEFLSSVVKRSLRWPKASYLKKFDDVHTLNHPKGMLELTESSDDFIRWQKRLDTVLGLAE